MAWPPRHLSIPRTKSTQIGANSFPKKHWDLSSPRAIPSKYCGCFPSLLEQNSECTPPSLHLTRHRFPFLHPALVQLSPRSVTAWILPLRKQSLLQTNLSGVCLAYSPLGLSVHLSTHFFAGLHQHATSALPATMLNGRRQVLRCCLAKWMDDFFPLRPSWEHSADPGVPISVQTKGKPNPDLLPLLSFWTRRAVLCPMRGLQSVHT